MNEQLLVISAGLGPFEVRRFVAELAQALVPELASLGILVVDVVVHGPDDAPRSIDLGCVGAVQRLDSLVGVHALVARSERRGKRARKRWFVAVRTHARAAAPPEVAILPADLVVESCRSGGPGGQHVNKTESAVRVLHRPSGLVVRVDGERSRTRNLARALERLVEALGDERRARLASSASERRASALVVERGRSVREWTRDHAGRLVPALGRDVASA